MTPAFQTGPLDLGPWGPSIRAYAQWLESHDWDAARHWALRLSSRLLSAVEGAVAEAVAWDFLVHRVDRIAPGRISDGGPDFRCETEGRAFLVEVTNLNRSLVTKRTKLTEEPNGPRSYRDLTALIKREVSGKAGQGAGVDIPYLVFVTTLHGMASQVCVDRAHVAHVLHSTTGIGGEFDPDRGEIVGPLRQITRMELSAFTRKYTTDPARRNVSGVLVGGFGTYPDVQVLGVLHPEPVRPFDGSLLREVPFMEFAVWPPDPRIVTRWTLPERKPKNRSLMRAWMELLGT